MANRNCVERYSPFNGAPIKRCGRPGKRQNDAGRWLCGVHSRSLAQPFAQSLHDVAAMPVGARIKVIGGQQEGTWIKLDHTDRMSVIGCWAERDRGIIRHYASFFTPDATVVLEKS